MKTIKRRLEKAGPRGRGISQQAGGNPRGVDRIRRDAAALKLTGRCQSAGATFEDALQELRSRGLLSGMISCAGGEA